MPSAAVKSNTFLLFPERRVLHVSECKYELDYGFQDRDAIQY